MPHSKRFMYEKVLHRVMSRIIRVFGNDELLIILERLNHVEQHNLRALTSALSGTLPPPVRFSLSIDFFDFLQKSDYFERWFIMLSCFPKRWRPSSQCMGFNVVAHELRTLYEENRIFLILLRCQSMKLCKKIFYNASRKNTGSFRALMTSLRRMKKALRGELNLSRLNLCEQVDYILEYFFDEMQSMQIFQLERLYESFAQNSLVETPLQYSVAPDGTIEPKQLQPMKIWFLHFSHENSAEVLIRCNLAFSFPKIGAALLDYIWIIAKEPVSVRDCSRSTFSQGMCLVLNMISLHQANDPFLGFMLRTWCHPQNPFFEFHLERMLHVKMMDGSTPTFLKIWKDLNPKMWSQPAFLSKYQDRRLSQMFERFYKIINYPEFFRQIEHFISENSSANLQSVRLFLGTMKETSLDKHFERMLHPFCLQPDIDPAFKNMF